MFDLSSAIRRMKEAAAAADAKAGDDVSWKDQVSVPVRLDDLEKVLAKCDEWS